MIRNTETGRFTPCNPEIQWMIPLADGDETYIDQDGKKQLGAYSKGTAEPGYKKNNLIIDATFEINISYNESTGEVTSRRVSYYSRTGISNYDGIYYYTKPELSLNAKYS